MSELLNCCLSNLEPAEAEERDIVHKLGIYHKTAHVWLYDEAGYVYFQVRGDLKKMYTSASGHVLAEETPEQAVSREAREELGIHIDPYSLELILIELWMADTETKHDYAFAHVYLHKVPVNFNMFKIDNNEVIDVVKIKADSLLKRLLFGSDAYRNVSQYHCDNQVVVKPYDLLCGSKEHLVLKYGKILESIIQRTSYEDK